MRQIGDISGRAWGRIFSRKIPRRTQRTDHGPSRVLDASETKVAHFGHDLGRNEDVGRLALVVNKRHKSLD